MNPEFEASEFCAVCGRDANGGRWFCHFYSETARLTLCSPHCAESYLHRTPLHANGFDWGSPAEGDFWVSSVPPDVGAAD